MQFNSSYKCAETEELKRQTDTDTDTERVGGGEGNERWESEECGDEEKGHSVLVMVRS